MKKQAQTGFTLVELIITMFIAILIVALGVPAYSNFVDNNRMITTTNELVTDMLVARSEAVKRNNPVTICASSDGASCSNANDWSTGWIVFDDVNANGQVDGATVFRSHGQVVGNQMSARITAGSATTFISFNGDGFPRTAANLVQTATFSICDHRGAPAGSEFARSVQLGASGRVRSSSEAGSVSCPP